MPPTLLRAGCVSMLFVWLLVPLSLDSQDASTGAICGNVFDPDGGPVPSANIAAINPTTGSQYVATADADGRFAIELLPPSDYTARAESKGMSPEVTPAIHVDVGGAAQLQFHMTLAGLA